MSFVFFSLQVPVNVEHRFMLAFAPDYERLTLMAKVEVFEHALERTPGNDLAKVKTKVFN